MTSKEKQRIRREEPFHRLADLLVDIRCAFRDSLTDYGKDCTEQAIQILRRIQDAKPVVPCPEGLEEHSKADYHQVDEDCPAAVRLLKDTKAKGDWHCEYCGDTSREHVCETA